jgi:hypothetical protein
MKPCVRSSTESGGNAALSRLNRAPRTGDRKVAGIGWVLFQGEEEDGR